MFSIDHREGVSFVKPFATAAFYGAIFIPFAGLHQYTTVVIATSFIHEIIFNEQLLACVLNIYFVFFSSLNRYDKISGGYYKMCCCFFLVSFNYFFASLYSIRFYGAFHLDDAVCAAIYRFPTDDECEAAAIVSLFAPALAQFCASLAMRWFWQPLPLFDSM